MSPHFIRNMAFVNRCPGTLFIFSTCILIPTHVLGQNQNVRLKFNPFQGIWYLGSIIRFSDQSLVIIPKIVHVQCRRENQFKVTYGKVYASIFMICQHTRCRSGLEHGDHLWRRSNLGSNSYKYLDKARNRGAMKWRVLRSWYWFCSRHKLSVRPDHDQQHIEEKSIMMNCQSVTVCISF